MEPLDKLETILRYTLKKREWSLEITKEHTSVFYITGLEHEITLLREILGDINSIKRNSPDVTDEMITKMYGTKKAS
jgi:hypothetical protein